MAPATEEKKKLDAKADVKEVGPCKIELSIEVDKKKVKEETLKLLGNQYLARLYQQAAKRYHLNAWDKSIQRKLKTLESIYDKMESSLSSSRLEFLEWIVIILIGIEVVMPFIKGKH